MSVYRIITQEQFDSLYQQHKEWLDDNSKDQPDFSDCDFIHIKFPETLNLERANLPGANLERANLLRANFLRADLQGANLRGANLLRVDLQGANLLGANLARANLLRADLQGANLRGANFLKADLKGANLQGANLQGAKLLGANLQGANLQGANLERANLRGSELDGVILEGVNLIGAITDKNQYEITNFQNVDKQSENKEAILLDQLKNELQRLKSKTEIDNEAINRKEKEINDLRSQLEKIGEEIKSGLDSSFDTLSGANREIENEIKRLNSIFWGCLIFIAIMFIPLIYIWYTAFCDLRNAFELSKILLYTSPSLIMLSFIFGAVVLMNRSQRQIVSLCKFMRKYSVIKIALKGYYSVQEKHLRTPQKAQDVFDAIIFENLKENIDTDKEEEKIQQMESKDRFLQKAVVDECLNALSKVKDVLK